MTLVERTTGRRWPWPKVVSALLMALMMAAIAPAHAEKHLYRGNAGEPKSLDPHRATGTWENHIIGDMFLGLYTEDVNAQPVLGAADSVSTSKDGLTWTFHIRPHTWSDGTPVTANDFVFAYRRILDPATAAEYRELLYPIKNAEKVSNGTLEVSKLGVSAPDAQTFVIQLENPAPYLPQILTHYTTYPLPEHIVKKYGSEWVKPGKMVSNGAYVLEEWRPHDHITLGRNPKFYDAANVKIDKVTFYPIEDDLAALKRYRAGEIDINERWPLTEYKWLKANIPAEARKYTYLVTGYWTFNTTKKPFNDLRVRKAVAESIDRQIIQKDIFFDAYGTEANSMLPVGLAGVENTARMPYFGMTMDARRADAKKLLAEAGYGPNNPLAFTYSYLSTPDAKRAAIAVQAMMKQVGVKMELTPNEPKVHYDNLKTKNYQAGNAAWVFDFSDAKNMLYLFQSSTIQQNYPGYKNPAYDALMASADREADAVKRGKLLDEAQALLLKDVPVAPLFYLYERTLVKPYVLNYTENPRAMFRTRWLDLGPKATEKTSSGGGFFGWLGSWFSGEAWSTWWNS
jgi:oligopeptide transport system substrate-binding protein